MCQRFEEVGLGACTAFGVSDRTLRLQRQLFPLMASAPLLLFSFLLVAAFSQEMLVGDDECEGLESESCAWSALQMSAKAQNAPYKLLKNKLSHRCLSFAGFGNTGDGLMILDCGAAISRMQQFRLRDGKLECLGEGESNLCVLLGGDGRIFLGSCDWPGNRWTWSKSYFRSYGWLKQVTPKGDYCIGVKGTMGKKSGESVVAERCSYMGLTDQRWVWGDD
eukprot:s5166_g3.t1